MHFLIINVLHHVLTCPGGSPSNGLYREAQPKRDTFFRPQVYERIGISLIEVYIYERVGKSIISVCTKTQKG